MLLGVVTSTQLDLHASTILPADEVSKPISWLVFSLPDCNCVAAWASCFAKVPTADFNAGEPVAASASSLLATWPSCPAACFGSDVICCCADANAPRSVCTFWHASALAPPAADDPPGEALIADDDGPGELVDADTELDIDDEADAEGEPGEEPGPDPLPPQPVNKQATAPHDAIAAAILFINNLHSTPDTPPNPTRHVHPTS